MKLFFIISALVFVGIVGVVASGALKSAPPVDAAVIQGMTATVYKSPTCGCCGLYAGYLEDMGLNVSVVNTQDMESVKIKYGIPTDMISCHTTVIGDYVVEGHVPVEAMVKLFTEKPAIGGIAMPGMPSGSPGMPGPKEPFVIYSLNGSDDLPIYIEL